MNPYSPDPSLHRFLMRFLGLPLGLLLLTACATDLDTPETPLSAPYEPAPALPAPVLPPADPTASTDPSPVAPPPQITPVPVETSTDPVIPLPPVPSALTFEDTFATGSQRWTPFLNYWRLEAAQWSWRDDGVLVHRCCSGTKEGEDGLIMVLGDGVEAWTDYRVTVRFKVTGDGAPLGLWVRGQYEEHATRAMWVTGYYVVVGGKPGGSNHYVRLAQLQTTTDCWGNACANPQNLYNFNNPHELFQQSLPGELTRGAWHELRVEVEGPRLRAWLDDTTAFDYTDEKEPFLTGTIGLKTYQVEEALFDDVQVEGL